MEVEFDDEDLDRLETDPNFTAGFAQEIVRAYRKKMQQIRAARDEPGPGNPRRPSMQGRRNHRNR